MSHYSKARRPFVLISLLSFALGAHATAPASGLGQSWPNAADRSTSANWHAYVFVRDGIRYVQINDANGTVHAAFAVAGREILTLPVGTDSERVSTPQQPLASVTNTAGQKVYSDSSIQVFAVPQADGTAAWNVVSTPSPIRSIQAATCNAQECTGNDTPIL